MKIPVSLVDVPELRKKLTYSYTPMGGQPVRVKGYRIDGDYLCVPRQLGLDICNQLQIPWEDKTSQGRKVKFPKTPKPKDYKVEPPQEIEYQFSAEYDVMFRAHTGWGKTIGSLIVAARLGRSVVVVVDQDNLKDQWIKVLKDPNLFGLKDEDIGIVQGPRCDYKGKIVTIAMVQTLVQKKFGYEFYG